MTRPLKGDENRRNITLRLEPSFIDRIDDKAEQLGVPRTALVENLLFNALTSPEMGVSSKDEESLDRQDDRNGDITNTEQTMFDTGFEMGRGEVRKEIESITDDNPFPALHQCEFRPWLNVCLFGSCNNANPNLIKAAHPKMNVRCSNCYEELGELQKAIELDRCPHCGADGNILEGMRD